MDNFVFKNNKNEREYKYEDVEFLLVEFDKLHRRSVRKRVSGEFKEALYKELLKKNRLRHNTLFETENKVYCLEKFTTKWKDGKLLVEEMFVIEIRVDQFQTKKLKRKKLKEENESIHIIEKSESID